MVLAGSMKALNCLLKFKNGIHLAPNCLGIKRASGVSIVEEVRGFELDWTSVVHVLYTVILITRNTSTDICIN